MARAKRTDRAEARRRYRAELAPDEETLEGTIEDDAPDDRPSSRSTAAARPTNSSAAPPARMGFGAAFRAAIHPVDVRGDLRSFPDLARTRGFWIPVLTTAAATAIIFVMGLGDVLSQVLYTYFVQAPALGGILLAGFLAKRASWLVGLVVGFVSAAGFAILVAGGRLTVATGVATEELRSAVLYGFVFSPIMGAIFAASAAWYRRFLQLSSPNRARLAAAQQKRSAESRGRARQKVNARR